MRNVIDELRMMILAECVVWERWIVPLCGVLYTCGRFFEDWSSSFVKMMIARFREINADVVRVQRELQERERLLDEIERADSHRVVLARERARLNERMARLREQITTLRHEALDNPQWVKDVRQKVGVVGQIERSIEQKSAEIRYIDNRITEYEERLVDLADSDSELGFLRAEQLALLTQRASQAYLPYNALNLSEFQELLATIADAQAHVIELEEAIIFGEKATTALRLLLDQVWAVWRAPNDYRLGKEIDRIDGLVRSAETRLSWFHRELWDVDRQFNDEPAITQRVAFFNDMHHHDEAQPAPRIDPEPIETLNQQVRDKLFRLRTELNETHTLIGELETRRERMVEELWRVDTFHR